LLNRKSDLRHIVNASWTRGSTIPRTVSIGGVRTTVCFDVFSPKAVGLLGPKLPPATRTRCIEIRMVPKRPDETTAAFNGTDDAEFATLRRKLARWAADNAAALKEARPAVPGLNNRAAANWKVLLAIAELAAGAWPERAHEAAERLTSLGVQLLAAFREVFDGRKVITSADMVAFLCRDPTSVWVEYGRRGPITQRQVADLLEQYEIFPDTIHPTGRSDFSRRGYRVEQFADAFARYLPVDPDIQTLGLVPSPKKRARTSAS
jgi:putative DNA primase/helicase